METIILKTHIKSKVEVCFNLSRSIDLHKISMVKTKENVIDGVFSGLIDLNEHVTWEAKHFGIKFKLTSAITEYKFPLYFKDIQIKGPFMFMEHQHKFSLLSKNETEMIDVFQFQSPYSFFGIFIDKIFLRGYLRNLLLIRNKTIKDYAESQKWKRLIND